jgi:TPR repeat protein
LRLSRNWGALGAGARVAVLAVGVAILAGGLYVLKGTGGDDAPKPAPTASVAPTDALSELRLAIKGSASGKIRASDFEFVTNGVKAQLLAPAKALADAGNAEGQFVLGMLLLETPGKSDSQGAFDALRKSAEQNYPDAQADLGILYQSGKAPGGRDLQKAADWFEKAAQNGDGKALFWMGCYHQFGWGGRPKDPQKAIDSFIKSVAARYPHATEALEAMNGASGAASPCK